MTYSVLIIGGGLAGLTSSIELARRGYRVLLIERKSYPHHKVCGEYVSNEVKPYLRQLGLNFDTLGTADLTEFWFSAPSGSTLKSPLEMGGFGISRFRLDEALYQLALEAGVEFRLNTTVMEVEWKGNTFELLTSDHQTLTSEVVLGAYGKRTRLDKQMHRDFMERESPYVGVKYHIRMDFPKNVIALHNFKNGYCGISAIENDTYCLCYLTERANVKQAGSIENMERTLLSQNPHLREIFTTAEFLYEKPEVINEVSFAKKESVENHILMAGDSAGLVTPLCGNGMAMAIKGGYMAATQIDAYYSIHRNREHMEKQYTRAWDQEFAFRLKVGRTVQKIFGHEVLSELALSFFSLAPPLLRAVIRNTHGKPTNYPGIK